MAIENIFKQILDNLVSIEKSKDEVYTIYTKNDGSEAVYSLHMFYTNLVISQIRPNKTEPSYHHELLNNEFLEYLKLYFL